MNKAIVEKGRLVADMFGDEVAVPIESRMTADHSTQAIDDIFGWKNANGAYIPFSDIYGAVKAELRAGRVLQDKHIKRKYITQALIKLGYVVKGKTRGGLVEPTTETDEDGCLVGGKLLPPNKFGQEMIFGSHAVNGLYRKYKNNYGFNGLEYAKLLTVVKKVTALMKKINREIEEVIVACEEYGKEKGLRASTIRLEIKAAIKEVLAKHLCD